MILDELVYQMRSYWIDVSPSIVWVY